MKSFKDYLIEKITKKEFDEALNNKNIMSGCEFEFYFESEFNGNQELLNDVIRSRDRLDEELSQYDKDLENYWSDYRDEYDKYLEAEKQINRAEEWINDIQQQIDDLDDLDTTDMTSQEYKNHLKERDKLLDDLTDQKDVKSDFQEIIDEWEDGVTEQRLLEEYEPVPSYNSLRNLNNLLNYLEDLGLINVFRREKDEINQYLWSEAMENERIPDAEDIFSEVFNIYIDNLALSEYSRDMGGGLPDESELENEHDFPVDIGPGWEIKEDGSLDISQGGMEISTGIYQVGELVDIIEKVFKWIDKKGETDSDCGFHIHLSMKTNNQIDPLKLILFVEEGKILEHFEERVGNTYAKSIKEGQIDYMEPFTFENLKKLAKKEDFVKELNLQKYLGVHLIELEKNHVEFRYIGGTNYHKKFKEIRENIANYAFWLSIACDPDFKRKEYLTKAAKLNNYYSYWYFNGLIEDINIYCERWLDRYEIDRKKMNKVKKFLLKPYTDKLKGISKPKTKHRLKDLDMLNSRDDIRAKISHELATFFKISAGESKLKQRLKK